jgi:hypothetical protein
MWEDCTCWNPVAECMTAARPSSIGNGPKICRCPDTRVVSIAKWPEKLAGSPRFSAVI